MARGTQTFESRAPSGPPDRRVRERGEGFRQSAPSLAQPFTGQRLSDADIFAITIAALHVLGEDKLAAAFIETRVLARSLHRQRPPTASVRSQLWH
jgi:hypothetical protein